MKKEAKGKKHTIDVLSMFFLAISPLKACFTPPLCLLESWCFLLNGGPYSRDWQASAFNLPHYGDEKIGLSSALAMNTF